MSELLRSKHAFGSEADVDSALEQGLIDEYDILFLKEGKIGWIDADRNKVILEDKKQVVTVDALPETGEADTVYICNATLYFWDGTKFTTTADEIGMTEEEVDAKIGTAVSGVVDQANAYTDNKINIVDEVAEKIKYEIAQKPAGTIVNYSEKEIRVMCPKDTAWAKQNVGANGDANKYYIGFKAYAPENAMSFKEGLTGAVDDEMFTFDHEFAGTDEYGRHYSIVWLPVAAYDETTAVWKYYGESSTTSKYIGWTYIVEWYDANGVKMASDGIRINLSNENCHTSIEPYYMNSAVEIANAYTDEQIANAISVVSF